MGAVQWTSSSKTPERNQAAENKISPLNLGVPFIAYYFLCFLSVVLLLCCILQGRLTVHLGRVTKPVLLTNALHREEPGSHQIVDPSIPLHL